jgi:hypothetical protein
MIKAEIIADSLNEFGNRIITYVIVFPRIVLAEFNTHRALSRNSASSRAIPFSKMVKMVGENPFVPIAWQKDHSGMQGTEYWTENDFIHPKGFDVRHDGYRNMIHYLEEGWREGSIDAVHRATNLNNAGLTKQMCNRMLETYMYHTAIVTATEWENFFALRAHPDTEIHLSDLAHKMLDAANNSIPKQLKAGEWHIPFGDSFDRDRLIQTLNGAGMEPTQQNIDNLKVRIATARCARVSYLNFEGKDDYVTDVKLYLRLLSAGHMSPFEHCAQAMRTYEYLSAANSGNFKGFIQHRKMLSGENKFDNRLIKK